MSNILFPSGLAHRHAFTPAWYEKKTPKPVFWLRAGNIADRVQYLADIEVEAGPEVFQFQKDAAFQEGLASLLPDRDDQPGNADERSRLIEILGQVRSGEAVPDADRVHLDKVWEIVAKSWEPLRGLIHREAVRNELLPAYAMLHFCTGIDGLVDRNGAPIEYEADARGRMAESVLMRIDPGDLWLTGTFAHNLQYGRSTEKNSSAPLKSGRKQGRSPAKSKGRG